MCGLTKSLIARKVLTFLTGDTRPYRLLPKWEDDAYQYLRSCLRLYLPEGDPVATDDRVVHFGGFWKLLQVLAGKDPKQMDQKILRSGDWPQDVNTVDRDTIVVALEILSRDKQQYCEAVMAYLCERTTALLNAGGDPRRNEKLANLADCLSDPLVFNMAHIRSLGQCIRALSGTGKDHTEVVQSLVRFWQKTPEVAQTGKAQDVGPRLLELVGSYQGTSGDLVVDLVSTFRQSADYCEDAVALLGSACVARCQKGAPLAAWPECIRVYRQTAESLLVFVGTNAGDYMGRFWGHVLDGLLSVPAVADTPENRLRLTDACLALYENLPVYSDRESNRLRHLEVLKDLARIAGLEPKTWKDALADACRSDVPDLKIRRYLYELLYQFLSIRSNTADPSVSEGLVHPKKMPDEVKLVLAHCMADGTVDRDLLDDVLDRLLRDINQDAAACRQHYYQYLSRGLWLATAFAKDALPRRCADRMGNYQLLRPDDHCQIHLNTVLRLLRSDVYLGAGPERMRNEIEGLFRLDTFHCPVNLPGMCPDEVQARKNNNLEVCQDVEEMMEGRQQPLWLQGMRCGGRTMCRKLHFGIVSVALGSIISFLSPIPWGGEASVLAESRIRDFEVTCDYDACGRLLALRRPDGTQIRYEYGRGPQPLGMVTPEGRTEFKYDRNGNCIEVRNADGRTECFYDPFGRLTKVSYDYPALAKSIVYEYDPWGRVQQATVSSPGDEPDFRIRYEHDLAGRLSYVSVKGVDISYAYDRSGSKITRKVGDDIRSVYSLTAAGQIERIDHFVKEQRIAGLENVYDGRGLLTEQTETWPGKSVRTSYVYDQAGRVGSLQRSDGLQFQFAYDGGGRLREITSPAGAAEIRRDDLGFVTGIGDVRLGRDPWGRIASVQTPAGTSMLDYDSLGLLREQRLPEGSVRHSYSADGMAIGSTFGPVEQHLVPNPLSPAAGPMAVLRSDRMIVSPVPDLALEFRKNQLEVDLFNGLDRPCARISTQLGPKGSIPAPAIRPIEPPKIDVGSFQIPQIYHPQMDIGRASMADSLRMARDPFRHGYDRASAADRSYQNVWNSIEAGQRLPLLSPTERQAHDNYWTSGEYWTKDPYYVDLAGAGLGSGSTGSPDELAQSYQRWPQEVMQVYGLTLARTAVDFARLAEPFLKYVGMLFGIQVPGEISRTRCLLDLVAESLAERIGAISPGETEEMLAGFGQVDQSVAAGRRIGRFLDTIVDWATNVMRVAEAVQDSIEPVLRINAFNGKVSVIDDYAMRNRRLLPWLPDRQMVFGADYRVDSVLNTGKLRDALGQIVVDNVMKSIKRAAQKRLTEIGTHTLAKRADDPGSDDEDSRRYPLPPRDDDDERRYRPPRDGGKGPPPPPGGPGGPAGPGGPWDGGGAPDAGDSMGGLFSSSLGSLGSEFQPKGVKLDRPAEFFGQIGSIRGVSYDPQTKRLALIGDGNPMLPAVRFDDFVVALHIAYGSQPGEPSEPMFSLDPVDPANPAGPWLKAVYLPNTLEGTHMGDVMFRADWVLKQYTFGVIADEHGNVRGRRDSSVRDYRSYMELVRENPAALRQGSIYSRYWILPLEMKLARQGNTLVFVRSTMQVQTRRMEFSGSGLTDSPDKSDPCAERFAEHFTSHYDQFAREAPVLEEVREAAKVVAIVKWLKEQGLGVNDFTIDWRNVPRQKEYVQKVPSLCQRQTVSLWGLGGAVIQLVGGVELAPRLIEVPATSAVEMIHSHIEQTLQGPGGTSVGELRVSDQVFRFSVLPLTGSSQKMLAARPIAAHEGITYAADETRRVRHAFDGYGNSADFEYNNDKLVVARLRTSAGWELWGRAVDSGGRQFGVRTANDDDLLYRFGPDNLLSEVSVNGQTVLRSKWDPAHNAVELQHVKAVEEYAIGDLTALSAPKKTEKIVATERLTWEKGKLHYSRKQMVDGVLKSVGQFDFVMDGADFAWEGGDLGHLRLRSQAAGVLVEESPAGTRTLEYDPGTNVLRKVTFQNGDRLEFLQAPNSSADCRMVLRVTRGSNTAEMLLSTDSIAVKDYDGAQTVYRYVHGLLEQVESPDGVTRCQYGKPGRLERIVFPDNSSLDFRWTEAANLLRLTISGRAAHERKAG